MTALSGVLALSILLSAMVLVRLASRVDRLNSGATDDRDDPRRAAEQSGLFPTYATNEDHRDH